MDFLQLINLGVNFGALGVVLMLIATGKLVAESWAKALVEQANRAADRAEAAAAAADTRADLVQSAMVEQTAAIRAVETLVRAQDAGRRQPS